MAEPNAKTPLAEQAAAEQLSAPAKKQGSGHDGDANAARDNLSTRLQRQQLITSLEQRLKACKQFIGDTQLPVKFEIEQEDAQDTDKIHEWKNDLQSSIDNTVSLSGKVERLGKLTSSIFHGKNSELERKLIHLEEYLNSENASVSQILLSLEAKRLCVLQNEPRLRETASMLKQVEELKEFVNVSSYAELLRSCKRINDLEAQGFVLMETTKDLSLQVETLALKYNSAMSLLTLAIAQQQRVFEEETLTAN